MTARRSVVGDDPWYAMRPADFEALAQAHGTPYFLYDANHVTRRIEAVRSAFDGLVKVYYAVKANPNLALLRAVRDAADGVDISSAGELAQACLAGFDPEHFSFAGPAKTSSELAESIGRAVGCISVESRSELAECVRIAGQLCKKANVILRVNPLSISRGFGLKMGGRPMQFGVDEEDLAEALNDVLAHPRELAFQGLHVYAGSQSFDPAGLTEGVEQTLRLVKQIEDSTSLICRKINLGGGFGVSHVEADQELDLAALSSRLLPIVRAFAGSKPVERRIIFELGRYLTADAGIYVSRVINAKTSRGKEFFMVDGGLHHHLAAAGTFGAALRKNFILRNLSRPDREAVGCTIAGPSCNPTDLLGIDVALPRPGIGDLIGVLKSGSYGLTASPLLFLGRQTPAELIREDGRVTLARRPRHIVEFN